MPRWGSLEWLAKGGKRQSCLEGVQEIATVIQLPGTLARVFWPTGTVEDFASFDLARVGVEHRIDCDLDAECNCV